MGSENESSVLAVRVLSFLKRKAGKGTAPSIAEEKAATAALQLLEIRYPGIASDPKKAIENLSNLARKSGDVPDPASFGDLNESGNMGKYQNAVQKLYRMLELMSNLQQKQHDLTMTAVRNLRG